MSPGFVMHDTLSKIWFRPYCKVVLVSAGMINCKLEDDHLHDLTCFAKRYRYLFLDLNDKKAVTKLLRMV